MALKVADLLVVITADPKGFEAATQRIGKNIQKLGGNMQQFGRNLSMRVTLPMLAIGGAATKMAMDFESATTRMVSLVGLNRTQVDGWKDDIHSLAMSTGRLSTELGEAMFFITSAGLRGDTAMKALEASAKAAALGMGQTKSVAFAAASAVNAYGLSSEDTEKVVAQLMMTVRMGNLEAATLAPVLGRVMPVASELGVSFDQLGASIAAMTRLGANSEESATALRQVMVSMMKPSKEAADTLTEMGLSAEGLRTQIREEGLLSVLSLLKEKFGDNTEATAAVFGNVRALTGVLNLVGKNAETTAEIFREVGAATEDDLAAAFRVAAETGEVQFKQALAEMQVNMIKLGEEIMPVVIRAMQTFAGLLSSLTETFANMSPMARDITVAFGGFLLVLGPTLTIVGMMTKNITWLVMALRNLGTSAVAATAQTTAMSTGFTVSSAAVQQTTLGLAKANLGLVTLAGTIGWAIGTAIRPWVNETLGLNDALDLVANKNLDVAKGMMRDKGLYEDTLANYNKQREALGLVGKQWEISSQMTEDNAVKLAANMEAVGRMIHKKKEEGSVLDEVNEKIRTREDIEIEVAEAAAQANEKHRSYVDALKEEYGLLSKEDVLKNLQDRTKAVEDMRDAKISEKQIQESMTPLLEEDLELLKQYKVPLSELPKNTQDMLKNLSGASPLLQQQISELGNLGNQYESMIAKVSIAMTDPVTGLPIKLKESLSGGFGEGIDEGIAYGQQAIDNWMEETGGIRMPIKFVIEDKDFQQWLDDVKNGRIPAGGGSVP